MERKHDIDLRTGRGKEFFTPHLDSSDCAYSFAKSRPSFSSDPSDVTCSHIMSSYG